MAQSGPPTRGDKLLSSLLILFFALKATALMLALGSIGELRPETMVINMAAIVNVPASIYIVVQIWRGSEWVKLTSLKDVGEILLIGIFAWAYVMFDIVEGHKHG